MTPNYHLSPVTPFPLELKEDQLLNLNQPPSSSSPASCHNFFEPVQREGGFYYRESVLLRHPKEVRILYSQAAGSCDHPGPAVMDESGSESTGLKLSMSSEKEERNDQNQSENSSSVKWMSSKMRLMKKMMYSSPDAAAMQKLEDHQKQPPSSSLEPDNGNNINNNKNTIRVCADCNTTKTPLWRSGPRGPKSLCNACGIRQRKARRAMAAAAANGTAVQLAAHDTSSNKKKSKTPRPSNNNSCLPFKKRCKYNSNSPSRGKKKLCSFEDLTLILSKNNSSALQRVFPQEEKEAAILLMALSYGLVHG
ncbi:hypothetical protein AB3S75_019518 [Citrus x aurantiifolia]